MNKKVLLLTASLLALTMLVTPVMSVSPKKIPVTITRIGLLFVPPTEVWISGNVQHGRGFTGGRPYFNIEGEGVSLTGSAANYYGDYNINLKNGYGAVHRKIVLTFPGGTFEGHNNWRGTFIILASGPLAGFPLPVEGYGHAVFQGTGNYHGWTFVFTQEAFGPTEAYILIP